MGPRPSPALSRRRRTRVRSWARSGWWTGRHTVSAAGVHRRQNGTYSAPDDHFTAGPDCRVRPSGIRRVGSAGRRPKIEIGIVSAAGIESGCGISSTPDDHIAFSPDCRVTPSSMRRVGIARSRPRICAGVISPTVIEIGCAISSTPDDHVASGPDCRVTPSSSGRVGSAGSCPAVCDRIVFSAVLKTPLKSQPPQAIISLAVHTAV